MERTKPCPKCRAMMELAGWAEHSGYLYLCPKCGEIGTERRVAGVIYKDDSPPMKRKKEKRNEK